MFRPTRLLESVNRMIANRPRLAPARRQLTDFHRLRHEPLEDRRMLAVVTVTNDLDVVNGDTSSIANLIANDGGDGIALREAIGAANSDMDADTVLFDDSLSGATIFPTGRLGIVFATTVDATNLTGGLTIDAQQNFGIIEVIGQYPGIKDVTLAGLTLTGGSTAWEGGAIRSRANVNLTLQQTYVTGNRTTGHQAYGGAIWAEGALTLRDSSVIGNHTEGINAHGGGIWAGGELTIIDSVVSGNSTTGENSRGGGIRAHDNVTLIDSTVNGNSTLGESAAGGGISLKTIDFPMYNRYATLSLTRSVVSGNSTTGLEASGGGIYATLQYGSLILTQSAVTGNSTSGREANGGGIWADGAIRLIESSVDDNSTMGYGARGGAIYERGVNENDDLLITNSTIAHNSTQGDHGSGGGIFSRYNVTLTNSTVEGNSTAGINADGGGVYTWGAAATTLVNSTISGNSTAGSDASGGGLFTRRNVTISQSTVTNNHAFGNEAATGGGVWVQTGLIAITDSMLAGNTSDGGQSDLSTYNGTFDANHSLIGDTAGLSPEQLAEINAGVDNLLDVDPLLGPLADNGGPTKTHALLLGSPAIDAGDPGFVAPPFLDQRGYYRVAGDRVDMGAFEFASVALLLGDGNLDGMVDGLDYLVWASFYGDDPALDPPGAPQNGDYNSDGVVDGVDYLVWAGGYGAPVPVTPVAVTIEPLAGEQLAAVDLALEEGYNAGATVTNSLTGPTWQTNWAFDSVFDKLAGKRRGHKRAWAAT